MRVNPRRRIMGKLRAWRGASRRERARRATGRGERWWDPGDGRQQGRLSTPSLGRRRGAERDGPRTRMRSGGKDRLRRLIGAVVRAEGEAIRRAGRQPRAGRCGREGRAGEEGGRVQDADDRRRRRRPRAAAGGRGQTGASARLHPGGPNRGRWRIPRVVGDAAAGGAATPAAALAVVAVVPGFPTRPRRDRGSRGRHPPQEPEPRTCQQRHHRREAG